MHAFPLGLKFFVISLLPLLIGVGPVRAEIPHIITYQGKVTDTAGTPVPDGVYPMRFLIYDAETAGTALWNSGARLIPVEDGVFTLLLGESPQPAIDLAFDEDYWLEIRVSDATQQPRTRLGSVGYAYMASGVVPGTVVAGAVSTGASAALAGVNTATTGERYGLYGASAANGGHGVSGAATATDGVSYGVYGEAASSQGRGVYGWATGSIGENYGVYGRSESTAGYAGFFVGNTRVTGDLMVDGAITGSGIGDVTAVNAGTGLDGGGTEGDVTLDIEIPLLLTGSSYPSMVHVTTTNPSLYSNAIQGTYSSTSGTGHAISGVTTSTSAGAVYGYASTTEGSAPGISGHTSSTGGSGVTGHAWDTDHNAKGVSGETWAAEGKGVYGHARHDDGPTYGVYGSVSSPYGYGVYYSGGLAGTGTKSCVVQTTQGPTLLFCQESPECWFEDFGEGQLTDGKAHVELDPLFLETVSISEANPLKVFVQLKAECEGTYVRPQATGFDVVELRNGSSDASFTYRVVAKRKGFEAKRLNRCEAARTDPYLYPEIREELNREGELERLRLGR